MTFLVHLPAPPLNRAIDRFYCPIGPMPYPREYVMPGPMVDLKVNFGGVVRARRAGASDWRALSSRGWCMGLWDRYHSVHWPSDLDYIGVSFRPGGLFALFGIEVHQLRNEVAPLDSLLGLLASELCDRLAEAPDVQARFMLLERMLMARTRQAREVDRLAPALKMLKQHNGIVSIAELVAATDVSHKHLVAMFNRVVGAPPKALARLYRLQHLLTLIEAKEPRSWTKVAHDFDYYDQPHFNKDFKRSTGHSPTGYAERRQCAQATNPHHARHRRLLPEVK